jgi:hypothetical protein
VYERIFFFQLVLWVCLIREISLFFYSPAYLDVITIEKTGENFRLIYDVKGRFSVHRITPEEAKVSFKSNAKIYNRVF